MVCCESEVEDCCCVSEVVCEVDCAPEPEAGRPKEPSASPTLASWSVRLPEAPSRKLKKPLLSVCAAT